MDGKRVPQKMSLDGIVAFVLAQVVVTAAVDLVRNDGWAIVGMPLFFLQILYVTLLLCEAWWTRLVFALIALPFCSLAYVLCDITSERATDVLHLLHDSAFAVALVTYGVGRGLWMLVASIHEAEELAHDPRSIPL